MKLNLSILKDVLCFDGVEDFELEMNEWIKNNIGDGEVSIREWLDAFGNYWSEWSDDYGDSGEIVNILVNDYKLSDDDIDKVMMEYWNCESIEEFKDNYGYNYDECRE
jgi:hypothetical protein